MRIHKRQPEAQLSVPEPARQREKVRRSGYWERLYIYLPLAAVLVTSEAIFIVMHPEMKLWTLLVFLIVFIGIGERVELELIPDARPRKILSDLERIFSKSRSKNHVQEAMQRLSGEHPEDLILMLELIDMRMEQSKTLDQFSKKDPRLSAFSRSKKAVLYHSDADACLALGCLKALTLLKLGETAQATSAIGSACQAIDNPAEDDLSRETITKEKKLIATSARDYILVNVPTSAGEPVSIVSDGDQHQDS